MLLTVRPPWPSSRYHRGEYWRLFPLIRGLRLHVRNSSFHPELVIDIAKFMREGKISRRVEIADD
ncbi:hypothetical protein [Sulfuracidifex metallicus]|uniref:Uncharacterized protein n=1 Tax=Sulfuracidifex metallicus DSM 6482 = JCM 9184 TaxID=523847 RepID=A0A6A9QXL6_SULME|nr:hypothetical protein [Sulfuracidifex metallicus]MUN29772.1 hypothetical protein [Sulfuracidifex metallicus DSM 6482 = JCM 9184]WOE51847.1 hypothetical protein RQ359_001187 [Sulfuracidifex metallicus DSM 6482 = JCM 9184]